MVLVCVATRNYDGAESDAGYLFYIHLLFMIPFYLMCDASRGQRAMMPFIILKSIAPRALYQMPTRFPAQRRPAAVY